MSFSNSNSDSDLIEQCAHLLVPQLKCHEMKLISADEADKITRNEEGNGEYLSISKSLAMKVILFAFEDPQYCMNEHLICACPDYDNVFGPVIIEGPLKKLKALQNNHKRLRKILANDIRVRQTSQLSAIMF
jgi:hypothetical protein